MNVDRFKLSPNSFYEVKCDLSTRNNHARFQFSSPEQYSKHTKTLHSGCDDVQGTVLFLEHRKKDLTTPTSQVRMK